MSGLVGLVPLADLLAEICGSRTAATTAAVQILDRGAHALPEHHDDLTTAARYQLLRHGVVTDAGEPVVSRAAELVAVCEILAAATDPTPPVPPDPRLVFSAPPGTVEVADGERLDGLILDVIRQATQTLAIGGAFWNDQGFDLLDHVLAPALLARRVPTRIYVNLPDAAYRDALVRRLHDLQSEGPVTVRWFCGPRPTMLHAKFVIRDGIHGYLGTANLTSWGMQSHIEAGVELTAGQSARYLRFLDELEAAGLFSDRPVTAPS